MGAPGQQTLAVISLLVVAAASSNAISGAKCVTLTKPCGAYQTVPKSLYEAGETIEDDVILVDLDTETLEICPRASINASAFDAESDDSTDSVNAVDSADSADRVQSAGGCPTNQIKPAGTAWLILLIIVTGVMIAWARGNEQCLRCKPASISDFKLALACYWGSDFFASVCFSMLMETVASERGTIWSLHNAFVVLATSQILSQMLFTFPVKKLQKKSFKLYITVVALMGCTYGLMGISIAHEPVMIVLFGSSPFVYAAVNFVLEFPKEVAWLKFKAERMGNEEAKQLIGEHGALKAAVLSLLPYCLILPDHKDACHDGGRDAPDAPAPGQTASA